jgi:hypothetical protein
MKGLNSEAVMEASLRINSASATKEKAIIRALPGLK